jgi:salicylate hydroxylase
MLPFMGQGAAQSLEDAIVLARCLQADQDNPEHALCAYTDRRRDHAAALQTASREQGRNLQLDKPADIAARNAWVRDDPEAPISIYDWAWQYDAEHAVNVGKRASSACATSDSL